MLQLSVIFNKLHARFFGLQINFNNLTLTTAELEKNVKNVAAFSGKFASTRLLELYFVIN